MSVSDVVSPVFEISGYQFGDAEWDIAEWDTGTLQLETVDAVVGGRRLFGRDSDIPQVWTLGLRTDAETEDEAQSKVAAFARAWRPPALQSAGATVALRYKYLGRWRRVYGRPRGMSVPSTGPLAWAGKAELVADFELADALHYDDALQAVALESVPPSSGGIVAPLVAPISTTRAGDTAYRFITVGGDAPTPLRVTFTGPITNPWVTVSGVRVALTGSVAYDQAVTVDARTRTVLRQDGASAAGMLGRRTRMDRLRLPPGTHEIRYGGTGQATVTVAWRNAWRTL